MEMETTKTKALAKIEKEYENIDSPEGEIAIFLESWVNFDENAAELILEGKKNLKGAFNHMREVARKKYMEKGGSAYLSHRGEKEAVLEYYGAKDPAELLEGGLMYAFYQNCASRWAPADGRMEEPQKKEETEQKHIDLSFDALFG